MADANVSQLEINGTTYDICDATARDSLSQYLPLTGGTISGNLLVESAISTNTLHVYNPNSTGHIETNKLTLWADTANANYAGLYFKSFNENNQINRNEPFIRCYGTGDSESSGGDALLIGNGGLTVVGSGESATTTYDYYTTQTTSPLYPNSEVLILASDNNMYFVTSANTTKTIERLRLTGGGALVHDDSTIDLTKSNNNVTDTKSHSWCITDKNGNYLSWLEGHAYTDGTTALVCKVRNYGTGSAVSHGFTMGIGNDGTRTVTFDQPSAWITGLGLNPSAITLTVASGFATGAPGVRAHRIKRLVVLGGYINATAQKSATTWVQILSGLPNPVAAYRCPCFIWNNGTPVIAELKVETDGKLYVWSPVAIVNTAEIAFSMSYVTAS